MAADQALLDALQAAHDIDATASEKWHKQEHQWKQGKGRYPKLARWFDRRHKEAFARQHDCRAQIMRLGGTVETKLGDTSYTDDPEKAFKTACNLLDDIRDAYQAVRDAAKEADDRATVERFHGYAKDIESTYLKGEQKLQQLEDLGLPLFFHKHSKEK